MAGGAGNVARNIAALGGRPVLFGLAGCDATGDELVRVIGNPARLVRSPDWKTILKLRVIAQQQQIVRIDDEAPRPATETEAAELLTGLADSLPQARVLILSDYGKGVLTPEVCASAITMARAAGALSRGRSQGPRLCPLCRGRLRHAQCLGTGRGHWPAHRH